MNAIYSQQARYLYELIQNADDANYNNAVQVQANPTLHFTLASDRLLVETNEDGFTCANVKAICAISESSKKLSGDDDSIGEKGIGFKSVFRIARSVHIQSGPFWSFTLENNSEDVLSIFCPIPTARETLCEGFSTRITLHLKEGMRHRVAKELQLLPENAIMFLRKITRLKIRFRDAGADKGLPQSREILKNISQDINDGGIIALRSVTQTRDASQGQVVESSFGSRYKSFGCKLTNLARDEKRHRQEAPVYVAFPLQENDNKPKRSDRGETVFAFLPMSRVRELPVCVRSYNYRHH